MQRNTRWILIVLAQLFILALAIGIGVFVGNLMQSNQTDLILTSISQNGRPTQGEGSENVSLTDVAAATDTVSATSTPQPSATVIQLSPTSTATPVLTDIPTEIAAASVECFVRTDSEGAVRVRVGPGERRPSVTFLPAGGDIAAVAISPDEQWLQLDLSGVTYAWIAIDDVTISGDCFALTRDDGSFRAAQSATETETPSSAGLVATATALPSSTPTQPGADDDGGDTMTLSATPVPQRTATRIPTADAFSSTVTAIAATNNAVIEGLLATQTAAVAPTETRSIVVQTATALAQMRDDVTQETGQLPDTGGGDNISAESTNVAAESMEDTMEPTALSTAITTPTSNVGQGGGLSESTQGSSSGQFGTSVAVGSVSTFTPAFTPTPVVVANAPLQLRSQLSGDIIGDGVISVYAPDSISGLQTARIELDLSLSNIYITPTPAGASVAFPVPTRITSTPRVIVVNGTPLPTPTERIPVFEEQGLQFYQRMGASLFCPPDTFVGCDDDYDLNNARIIPVSRPNTSFTWLVRATDGIEGVQDLSLELWHTGENIDGDVEFITDWSYGLTLNVLPPEVEEGLPFWVRVMIVVLSFVGVLMLTLFDWRPKERVKSIFFDKNNTDKPKVFISYRRKPSWSVARSLADKLQKRGADVFLDVDDINDGRFADVIQQAIADCDYFVPILTPTTLESEWVRREIETAIEQDKVIIPFMTDGFSFSRTDLPESLAELPAHNAIDVTPAYFDAAIDRLAARFLKLDDDES